MREKSMILVLRWLRKNEKQISIGDLKFSTAANDHH